MVIYFVNGWNGNVVFYVLKPLVPFLHSEEMPSPMEFCANLALFGIACLWRVYWPFFPLLDLQLQIFVRCFIPLRVSLARTEREGLYFNTTVGNADTPFPHDMGGPFSACTPSSCRCEEKSVHKKRHPIVVVNSSTGGGVQVRGHFLIFLWG